MATPRSVSRADMLAAIKPLCSLLDVHPLSLFDVSVSPASIDFTANPTERKECAGGAGAEDAIGVVVHRYSVEVS